jgi:hypothetical protein
MEVRDCWIIKRLDNTVCLTCHHLNVERAGVGDTNLNDNWRDGDGCIIHKFVDSLIIVVASVAVY